MGISSAPDPKVREHLESLVVSSGRTSKISFAVSVVALCVAAGSVYFAYKDSRDDENWQESQLEILEEISSKLDAGTN